MSGYPADRPQFYALAYLRWMIDSGVNAEAGPDVVALMTAVVLAEDRVRYARAVNFYNDQLCHHAGFGSIPAMIRARKRAVELGLLEYTEGAKRRPGAYLSAGFSNESLEKAEGIRKESVQKAEGIRKESEKKAPPSIPSPNPEPIPSPKPISCASASDAASDPDLAAWLSWWNELKADGLVSAGVAAKPSKGIIAGWKRVKRSPELRGLLADRKAVRDAIAKSEFVRAPWFTLPKLFGGTNKEGDYIAQKLMNGGYADKGATKAYRPGTNYDPKYNYEGAF